MIFKARFVDIDDVTLSTRRGASLFLLYTGLLTSVMVLIMMSAPSHAAQDEVIVTMAIKPIACIVNKIGEPCKLTITVTWQATTPIALCLLQIKQKMYCWQTAIAGVKKMEIDLVKSTTFKLVNRQQQTKASVNVVINAASSTRYRRRLRSDWSVF